MSPMSRNVFVLALIASVLTPAAHARTVTLTGNGVAITYEDRALAVLGGPSLIATSLMRSPAGFGAMASGEFDDGIRRASGVAVATGDTVPRSFADGVALSFSLDEAGRRERDLRSLLLAGLGLFVLIARQRLAASWRAPNAV